VAASVLVARQPSAGRPGSSSRPESSGRAGSFSLRPGGDAALATAPARFAGGGAGQEGAGGGAGPDEGRAGGLQRPQRRASFVAPPEWTGVGGVGMGHAMQRQQQQQQAAAAQGGSGAGSFTLRPGDGGAAMTTAPAQLSLRRNLSM